MPIQKTVAVSATPAPKQAALQSPISFAQRLQQTATLNGFPLPLTAAELDLDTDEDNSAIESLTDATPEDPLTDEDVLAGLIVSFLKLNTSPTDDQVHSLAHALGLSKERLEEEIYALTSVLLDEETASFIKEVKADVQDDDSFFDADIDNDGIPDSIDPVIELDIDEDDLTDPEMQDETAFYTGSTPPLNDDEAAEIDGEPDLDAKRQQERDSNQEPLLDR